MQSHRAVDEQRLLLERLDKRTARLVIGGIQLVIDGLGQQICNRRQPESCCSSECDVWSLPKFAQDDLTIVLVVSDIHPVTVIEGFCDRFSGKPVIDAPDDEIRSHPQSPLFANLKTMRVRIPVKPEGLVESIDQHRRLVGANIGPHKRLAADVGFRHGVVVERGNVKAAWVTERKQGRMKLHKAVDDMTPSTASADDDDSSFSLQQVRVDECSIFLSMCNDCMGKCRSAGRKKATSQREVAVMVGSIQALHQGIGHKGSRLLNGRGLEHQSIDG